MKVCREREKTCMFVNLSEGDVFKYLDTLYIKTDATNTLTAAGTWGRNAVDLSTGKHIWCDDSRIVTPVDGAFVEGGGE